MTNRRPERVLLVEDDASVVATVREALGAIGVVVEAAGSIGQATPRVVARTFDAIVLDLGLPDGSGMDFAGMLRKEGVETPILMLTGRVDVPDRLAGFARGADDYVCKPFVPEELAARVGALLRRTRPERSQYLRYSGCRLDLLRRTVECGDKSVGLSDREASLLAYLMQRPEEALPREQLAQDVFGVSADADTGVVNVYVNYLRNKLEHGLGLARLIHTIRGTGYMLSIAELGEPLTGE